MSLTFEVVINEDSHTLSPTANVYLNPPVQILGWMGQKFGQVWLFLLIMM